VGALRQIPRQSCGVRRMSRKLMASAIMLSLAHSGMSLAQCVAPSTGRNYNNVPHGKGQRKANKSNRWR
jgi:hypothetical protein